MRSAFALAWISIAVALSGCGGCGNEPSGAPCEGLGTDEDGDNFGDGCPAGDDCNDFDPSVHEDCCADDPTYQGCPCSPGVDTVVSCFDGPDEVQDTPPCMKGSRSCQDDGFWGACGGQVLPHDEICDGADNDCDTVADEGVESPCGNCLPGCDDFGVDTDPFPMDEPAQEDGVGLDENGDLVLDQTTYEDHYLWIANDAEGTVSKIDTRTGNEVARYPSVTHDPARLINHVGRPIAAWDAGGGGFAGTGYADNRPSRTAIDFFGDMWVANRAHDVGPPDPNSQPSVTKIMNDIEACPDLNGNGTIDTSRDLDTPADGIQPDEFVGESDECIMFTVVVGALGGTARALAIDAGDGSGNDPGNAWVGMWGEQAFYQINGVDGSIMQRVDTPGVRSYGAAIDSIGRLWTLDHCCGTSGFGFIDTTQDPAPWTIVTKPVVAGGSYGNYGITVDLEDRVWIGAYPYGDLQRYDPATNTWADAQINGYFGNGHVRGVGIDSRGNVWAALHPGDNDGLVARIDADTLASTGVWQLDEGAVLGTIPVGVGVDFDGDVWTVNQATSNASRLHIDQTTGEPAPHPATGQIVDVFPVGRNPYTYSDFTGLGLRTVTRPSGEWSMPIQGCEGTDQAHWTEVSWDATTPPGTSVEIYVRVGDDLTTLEQQTLYGPWLVSPADLQAPPEGPVPDGRYLLLIIKLLTDDRDTTPIVHGFDVEWGCPGDVPEFAGLPGASRELRVGTAGASR